MPHSLRIGNLFRPARPVKQHDDGVLPLQDQLDAWRKAVKKMRWGIRREEFDRIPAPAALTAEERAAGFAGTALFYGFGDDGSGRADTVRSGESAWDYAGRPGEEA
jgi:hypothetical protein